MAARKQTLFAVLAVVGIAGIGAIWVLGNARSFWSVPEVDVGVPQHVLDGLATHRELAGAKEMLRDGRLEEALAIFDRVAAEKAGTRHAYDALVQGAKCRIKLERYEEAIRACDQVLAPKSDAVDFMQGRARIERARALVLAGRKEEGFRAFDAIVEKYKGRYAEMCADALLERAALHWKARQYGLARSEYCRVIEEFPGGEQVKADRAELLIDGLRKGLAPKHLQETERRVRAGEGVHVTAIAAGVVQWSKDGGPYLVTEPLTVPSGGTLRIDAGAEVRFAIQGGLVIQGTLEASGTKEAPIRLLPLVGKATESWWAGVQIKADDGAAPSRLAHVRIEGAETGVACSRGTVTLEACALTFCHVAAVLAKDAGALTARDCQITDCFRGARCTRGGTLRLVGGRVAGSRGDGVVFQLSPDVSIQGTVVEDNHHVGVRFRDKADGRMTQATIRNNGEHGIVCMGASAPRLTANQIQGNQGMGILFEDRSTAYVEGTRIRENRAGGIRLAMSNEGLLKGNWIEQNGGPGLECGTGSKPEVAENRIARNAGPGVLIQPGGGGRFVRNDLSGNAKRSLVNHSSSPINAAGNYWGSNDAARVAELVEDRADDEQWGPVTVEPWLKSAPKIASPASSAQ